MNVNYFKNTAARKSIEISRVTMPLIDLLGITYIQIVEFRFPSCKNLDSLDSKA